MFSHFDSTSALAPITTITAIAPRGFFLHNGPPEFDFDVVNRATQIALIAHAGQTRKDGNTPQMAHPLAVQGLLAQAGVLDAALHAVALLHDTVEDNPVQGAEILETITHQLGKQTAQMGVNR
jgi:(p)ppGpp synthase/HD superfamily hydrolase